jgi:hypothetical protein
MAAAIQVQLALNDPAQRSPKIKGAGIAGSQRKVPAAQYRIFSPN